MKLTNDQIQDLGERLMHAVNHVTSGSTRDDALVLTASHPSPGDPQFLILTSELREVGRLLLALPYLRGDQS